MNNPANQSKISIKLKAAIFLFLLVFAVVLAFWNKIFSTEPTLQAEEQSEEKAQIELSPREIFAAALEERLLFQANISRELIERGFLGEYDLDLQREELSKLFWDVHKSPKATALLREKFLSSEIPLEERLQLIGEYRNNLKSFLEEFHGLKTDNNFYISPHEEVYFELLHKEHAEFLEKVAFALDIGLIVNENLFLDPYHWLFEEGLLDLLWQKKPDEKGMENIKKAIASDLLIPDPNLEDTIDMLLAEPAKFFADMENAAVVELFIQKQALSAFAPFAVSSVLPEATKTFVQSGLQAFKTTPAITIEGLAVELDNLESVEMQNGLLIRRVILEGAEQTGIGIAGVTTFILGREEKIFAFLNANTLEFVGHEQAAVWERTSLDALKNASALVEQHDAMETALSRLLHVNDFILVSKASVPQVVEHMAYLSIVNTLPAINMRNSEGQIVPDVEVLQGKESVPEPCFANMSGHMFLWLAINADKGTLDKLFGPASSALVYLPEPSGKTSPWVEVSKKHTATDVKVVGLGDKPMLDVQAPLIKEGLGKTEQARHMQIAVLEGEKQIRDFNAYAGMGESLAMPDRATLQAIWQVVGEMCAEVGLSTFENRMFVFLRVLFIGTNAESLGTVRAILADTSEPVAARFSVLNEMFYESLDRRP